MKKGKYISILLRSPKSIFSSKDIALFWGDIHPEAGRVRLNYYVKAGELIRIRKGFYAKDKNYNKLELATRIFTPAYVSFETVLAQAGIIFQYYDAIFVASYLTRHLKIDGQDFIYKKLKDSILMNTTGVGQDGQTAIASPERAFLDTLYAHTDYHFDNLRSLNWQKVFELLPLYGNFRMINKVNLIFKENK
jgi:hypothetical protein